MSIASVSVKRPIATTMVYLIVIVFGAVSFRYLPVDLLPPIEFPELNIEVNYGNVGPEEMELIVTEQLAIVQTTPWEHILELQQMQSRDLLDIIRAKQEQNEALKIGLN